MTPFDRAAEVAHRAYQRAIRAWALVQHTEPGTIPWIRAVERTAECARALDLELERLRKTLGNGDAQALH